MQLSIHKIDLAYLSALSRSSCASSASSRLGTMKRAIKNCDCCWAAAAAAAADTPPRMLHVPIPDDTIGSEDDDAIGASREPVALSVIIELDCWDDELALAAALLPPVAFVAEDTTGCC